MRLTARRALTTSTMRMFVYIPYTSGRKVFMEVRRNASEYLDSLSLARLIRYDIDRVSPSIHPSIHSLSIPHNINNSIIFSKNFKISTPTHVHSNHLHLHLHLHLHPNPNTNPQSTSQHTHPPLQPPLHFRLIIYICFPKTSS